MSEDRTHEFPQDSIGERILAELAGMRTDIATINSRLGRLEDRLGTVETRLDTLEIRFSAFDGRLSSFDNRLSAVETRLGALGEKVEARLRETRPIWEGIQARLTGIESELKTLNRQFRSMMADMFQLRVRVETLEGEQPA